MPGLDRLGRPVGYGDGRDPSLADKVRLLQQLVKVRQALPAGKKPVKKPMSPVAGINPPKPRPVLSLPFYGPGRGGNPRGFDGRPPDRNGNGGRPVVSRPTGMPLPKKFRGMGY